MAVFDDGSGPALYLGGSFASVDGVTANDIAKWDGTSWSAVGGGLAGTSSGVGALTVFDDGHGPALYAGGAFVSAGGVAASNVAMWDGAHWSALGSGLGGPSDAVAALAAFDDGHGPALYAGGSFTTAGGVTANHIAKWKGSAWSPVGGGMAGGADESVYALVAFDDGHGPALIAGGPFDNAGGTTMLGIARWNGSVWSPLDAGMNGAVFALATFDDGSGPALFRGRRVHECEPEAGQLDRALERNLGGRRSAAAWAGPTSTGSRRSPSSTTATARRSTRAACFPARSIPATASSRDGLAARSSRRGTDLGFSLAGVDGAPTLVGTGTLTQGSAGSLALSHAAPSEIAFLFAATSGTPTPFKCGTLVPVPIGADFLLVTNPLGTTVAPWSSFSAGLSGLSFYFQCAAHDPAAACGVSLSNALRADVP